MAAAVGNQVRPTSAQRPVDQPEAELEIAEAIDLLEPDPRNASAAQLFSSELALDLDGLQLHGVEQLRAT